MRFTLQTLGPQIEAIARVCQRMNRDDRRVWQTRLRLMYGDMDGQRQVDFGPLAANLDRNSCVIGIESLYYLIAVLLSSSAWRDDPAQHLADRSRLSNPEFDRFLATVLRGNVYEDLGITGCTDIYPMDWLTDGDQESRERLREVVRLLSHCWDGSTLKFPGDDPLQTIHRQLIPGNLAHITGQFFSPEWLAETLIDDVQWTPDQTLIDPFSGSGVFLVKALRRAVDAGCCPFDALKQIVGIDIDPFAAVAARANLALFLARCPVRSTDVISFNVICADAIGPSIATENDPIDVQAVFRAARHYGLDLERWKPTELPHPPAGRDRQPPLRRRQLEQLLTSCIKPADVVATNPPWVGWEYLSRPYRELIRSAWTTHDLYQSSGLEAAFLKEDLSNLALLAAWDAYLRDQGRSVVILRPATMHSEIASRGVRRLSLREDGVELKLEQIRTFDSIRMFKSARTPVATWMLRKGAKTEFPVPVLTWHKIAPRWNPQPTESARSVASHVRCVSRFAEPTDPDDYRTRWIIASADELQLMRPLRGSNGYTPRMGVFTGGANAIFYLRAADASGGYRNVTTNSRRKVPEVDVDVEPQLVHWVVRGRDIQMWHAQAELRLLMPHTEATQMRPIPEEELQTRYPKTYRYLSSMKEPLRQRNGFANWEKKLQQQYFYTLQRIGAYTFAPYKVCWRYIANEFTICVLERDREGKVILPNDKVMFIPLDDPGEAYYVAGFLSARPVNCYVKGMIEKRQISTGVIKSIGIPKYDPSCDAQRRIGDACRQGHAQRREDPTAEVDDLRQRINDVVANQYG